MVRARLFIDKAIFAERLSRLLQEKNWSQSDLARQANLPRDRVSTYVRGKSAPTESSLLALAGALGIAPTELVDSAVLTHPIRTDTLLEMSVDAATPSEAHLRVDRRLSLSTAIKIVALIEQDRLHERRVE